MKLGQGASGKAGSGYMLLMVIAVEMFGVSLVSSSVSDGH